MHQKQHHTHNYKSSFRESFKALEADIRHANTLAAALPRDYKGDSVQMKLSYSPFASLVLFLIEWMDFSWTDTLPSYLGLLHILVYKEYIDGIPTTMSVQERIATLREFYAVIYPSLKQLEGDLIDLANDNKRTQRYENFCRTKVQDQKKNLPHKDLDDRDDECAICMETSPKMVLPKCGHAMCIGCFRDWNVRSESCPFCRDSLKRVSSGDLWVLTTETEAVDMITLAKENLRYFYLYIENLPSVLADSHLMLYDYLI